jgi:hypothetical protein
MLDEFNKAQLVTENKKFRESENSYWFFLKKMDNNEYGFNSPFSERALIQPVLPISTI